MADKRMAEDKISCAVLKKLIDNRTSDNRISSTELIVLTDDRYV